MASNSIKNKAKSRLYAQALIDSAYGAGKDRSLYVICCELNVIKKAFLADSSLSRLVLSQSQLLSKIDHAQATEVINKVFEGINDVIREILVVMLMNLDMSLIVKVIDDYSQILLDQHQMIVADVTTFVELDDHLRGIITEKLQKDFGCKIYLQENIDQNILGGIIIKANGRILDCSVLSKVKRIKSELMRFRMAN